ncbi:bifunctional 5,10-methylenetetrahydrofolate dehydrogenase/5,10-methenyltetrahydrofolate cyclohydrolase [Oscillochloris sp. ZM17-4]|uniref:bifunctional 5,10-methylenetetrahydrofolate dehydrogenase/5,10-methenyltetrahydrofolate cyclohydrolase n=1 Tax=Oscillochloris sp. ZM17-4 TaxID=2866714 RepID=UPI001C73AD34|nr:bifunctional 5,10-methylenetetrahydrofolate dehydrogenase/5,10-methenyltetrahydrofolate cyclohydrolase [Oscillochloris sp. ZM17-4]MBX0327010.1 bifunctional 5,10-methylenetetrahydrofolate dehydrogenase/5,10-methenyltetrahydrofolate cyclohydrolase [Oscillochloris sp. ZM17-4]
MAAVILDGRALAREMREDLSLRVAAYVAQHHHTPTLGVIHVYGDRSAERYVRSLQIYCNRVGMNFKYYLLHHTATQRELESAIHTFSSDVNVDGVIIQMPLPAKYDSAAAVSRLDHRKDIDGVHPINVGLLNQNKPSLTPNTPTGGMLILERYGIELAGRDAVVIGRSAIVGGPMSTMLMNAEATVEICHRATRNLADKVRRADIVVTAAGKIGLVTGDMLKPGATVIDFGINVRPDNTMCGDVDFASAVEVAGAITPVPGGTGPVTTMVLLNNVLTAAMATHVDTDDEMSQC